VIVGELSEKFSHHSAEKSLSDWLNEKGIPLLSGVDTRALTQKLREHGVMLGQIVPEGQEALPEVPDPNEENLVAEVSCKAVQILEPDDFCGITIAAIDTGIKNNILRSFLRRGVRIIRCPWDADISKLEHDFDALFLSNGPGDPEAIADVVGKNIHFARSKKMPVFGICLGNQILALACGAKTYKMKYGHRGVNQPCQDMFTKKAVITSQNHGFAVDADSLPEHFEVYTNSTSKNYSFMIKRRRFFPSHESSPQLRSRYKRKNAGAFKNNKDFLGTKACSMYSSWISREQFREYFPSRWISSPICSGDLVGVQKERRRFSSGRKTRRSPKHSS
jgi:carbamoyl-phosphate synthase small subunit